MKKLIPIIAIAFLVGCTTPSRTVYNTLASTQITTSSAYNGYLDLVIKGNLTTNSVPTISKDYNVFQMVWNSAVVVAQFNTNTVAPADVAAASAKVITDIATAKGQ